MKDKETKRRNLESRKYSLQIMEELCANWQILMDKEVFLSFKKVLLYDKD
jgi:hypothetical protein